MYLGNQPALSYTSFAKQDFTTSATTSYTLDNPVANANELALFINFVRQEPTTAYTASGVNLNLTSATSASDDMYCVFLGKAVQTVNPPAGSVGISQLSATGTKDSTTFLRGDNTFASAGSPSIVDNGTATTISIDSSNNVGIGTSSPQELVDISSTAPRIRFTDTSVANLSHLIGSQANDLEIRCDDGNVQADSHIGFKIDGTERMRITSDGRLQLATTSNMPYGGNQVRFSFEFDSSSAPYYGIEMKDNGSAGTTYGIIFSRSSRIGSISYNASSVSYNTTSDYRLKNNISDVLNAIDRVKQLKPIRFNFISEPDKTVDGFLAHEVQEVVPEAIVGEKDAVETYIDDDGNEQTRPSYQGIDQSKLVPLLTAGLQEAIAKIETLEARITALENA